MYTNDRLYVSPSIEGDSKVKVIQGEGMFLCGKILFSEIFSEKILSEE